MRVTICDSKKEIGLCAAKEGAAYINEAVFNLAKQDIDWSKVNIFHLDEFIGLDPESTASSQFFIREYLFSSIGKVKSYTPIDPEEKNLERTLKELNETMKSHPLDVAFICIGENGHLAFNDPPADLDTTDPYIVVELQKRSRRQQVSEGWFQNLDMVPDGSRIWTWYPTKPSRCP